MGKVIGRCPQILTYSMEQRVLPIQHKLIECGLKVRFLSLKNQVIALFLQFIFNAAVILICFVILHVLI